MTTNNSETEGLIYNWSNKKILIAEDEHANFSLIERILLPTKITILHAENGEEAIKMFMNNQDVNIILMDIRMPEISGVEATKQIRNINRTVPILALTAFALTADEVNALNYGCSDYISKPAKPQYILQKINEFIK
ncbi:MAG: response regulator [Bacteroidales bacterium]|jgi:CheY-like chemotaxis protein|nr:response regulator [Bacteroidales bacterium]